ncbi:hypothetical protein CPB83DRAFT_130031 [Crepidotus variabilis]|uniref:Uncharacterized protein n=1 Tax=Crepidotus variabilis TaxID=179855 RepID=A0A9P6ELE8_9AGAR|nr:hypothetical protein CPB83DRAFT_130031 [Crepidotus variabilis]
MGRLSKYNRRRSAVHPLPANRSRTHAWIYHLGAYSSLGITLATYNGFYTGSLVCPDFVYEGSNCGAGACSCASERDHMICSILTSYFHYASARRPVTASPRPIQLFYFISHPPSP